MPRLVLFTQQGTWGPLALYVFTSVAPIAVDVGGRNVGLPVERSVNHRSRACVVPCLFATISQSAPITRPVFHRRGESRAVQTTQGERTQSKSFRHRRDDCGIVLPLIPSELCCMPEVRICLHLLWVNSWRQQSGTVNVMGGHRLWNQNAGATSPLSTRRLRAIP